jgi:RND family efflux transporter MFP subunit
VIASDRLDLSAAVPVTQLARMRPRQRAWVTSDGDTTAYPGQIEALTPAVDSVTNAGQVRIRIPNTAGRLRAGAGATARVALGVRRHVLVVPDSALVIAGDRPAVFVVGADSVAHQQMVTVGVRQAGRIEVRGALHPGDAVVTTGAAGLQDGMHVVPTRGPTVSGPATTPR